VLKIFLIKELQMIIFIYLPIGNKFYIN